MDINPSKPRLNRYVICNYYFVLLKLLSNLLSFFVSYHMLEVVAYEPFHLYAISDRRDKRRSNKFSILRKKKTIKA